MQTLLDQPVLSTDSFLSMVGGPSSLLVAQAIAEHHVPLTGRRIGTFEIKALLGLGGMGEVYRAHDTRLGRDVAIKVLPGAFTSDSGRLANFEREARVVASLNNPHIAAIHGIEESDGIRGLVLELVEGETLAQKLADASERPRARPPTAGSSQLRPPDADALEAAHEKGITHRDLKPRTSRSRLTAWSSCSTSASRRSSQETARGVDLTHAHTVDCGRHRNRARDRHGRLHESRAGARKDGGQTHATSGRLAACCTKC